LSKEVVLDRERIYIDRVLLNVDVEIIILIFTFTCDICKVYTGIDPLHLSLHKDICRTKNRPDKFVFNVTGYGETYASMPGAEMNQTDR
jgi:hypothetical protein